MGRGAVYPASTMVASEAVTELFGFVETTVLAFEDLYGGKLAVALDRQHPRNLYDVKLLYENEGLTADLFRTFMVSDRSSTTLGSFQRHGAQGYFTLAVGG